MFKKEYVLAFVVILLIAGAISFLTRGKSQKTGIPTSTPKASQNNESQTVAYTDSGFSPESLTIKTGSVVDFVSGSKKAMWVASDPHPIHTDFSDFDQLKSSDKFSFEFSEVGTYKYHNHLAPSDRGVIIVE